MAPHPAPRHDVPTMPILRRLAGPLLLLGAAGQLIAFPVGIAAGMGSKELPWLSIGIAFVAMAALVYRRLPDQAIAIWFAIVGGLFGVIQSLDGVLTALGDAPDRAVELAWTSLVYHLGAVGAVTAFAHLLGLFPDGAASASETRVLRLLRVLFVFPPLAFVANETVALPYYHATAPVPNPYHLSALAPLDLTASIGLGLTPAALIVGVVLLVRRYRRGSRDVRQRIRWLLIPATLAGFAASIDTLTLLAPEAVPRVVVDALWLTSLLALPVAISIALLRPGLLDVDRVLRRSLVYGSLWTVIALTYVGAAAPPGLVAGQRFDVGIAILLTVAATLVFQPARRRLEELADRWVFGARVDPARLVSRLGASLAETFDLDTLLPHIAQTLQHGLGLRWVRVGLATESGRGPEALAGTAPVEDVAPAAIVPIVLGAESLGFVECGPRSNGTPLTEDDVVLVTTLARQAALAVRNVKLTAELGVRLQQVHDQATELERSRTRLVRAQEAERRRIERNIHDGVQQDLVALLGHAGRLQTQLARDPAGAAAVLEQLQSGLQRVIADLRELAHGIHPTLLTDRGLLEAVEALAARSPIPVTVRADPSLRGLRFSEAVEGAGYFTVAEALTNVLKHADAQQAAVSLVRANGVLRLEVSDDGTGFDRPTGAGDGLLNLAERLEALGGRLEVDTGGQGTTVRALLSIPGPVSSGG
jgi:signal transduction histidine kinase